MNTHPLTLLHLPQGLPPYEYSPPYFVTHTPGLAPNDESLEFLANALVVTVSEEARAKTMRDLPEPDVNMPEVRTYVCLVKGGVEWSVM